MSQSTKIIINGWMVDIFLTENSSLGITVEKVECVPGELIEDDNRACVDIFVNDDLEVTSG